MNRVVQYKSYPQLPVVRDEVLRYAGCKTPQNEISGLLEQCLRLWQGQSSNKVCYLQLPVTIRGNICDFGAFQANSRSLALHLSGCSSVILFAATIGVGIDRLITKYSGISPAKALLFQSIGAQQIEALCDAFCQDISISYQVECTCRFSPGYGDLPLQAQKHLFAVLDCEKKIGLTLNSSLLMSPTKSVTAFIGIK